MKHPWDTFRYDEFLLNSSVNCHISYTLSKLSCCTVRSQLLSHQKYSEASTMLRSFCLLLLLPNSMASASEIDTVANFLQHVRICFTSANELIYKHWLFKTLIMNPSFYLLYSAPVILFVAWIVPNKLHSKIQRLNSSKLPFTQISNSLV